MIVFLHAIFCHILIAKLQTQICQYFPSVGVNGIDPYIFNNEIGQKGFMSTMTFFLYYFGRFPSVKIFIRKLKFHKLIVQLFEGRLVMGHLQSLIVHRRSIQP